MIFFISFDVVCFVGAEIGRGLSKKLSTSSLCSRFGTKLTRGENISVRCVLKRFAFSSTDMARVTFGLDFLS